MSRSDLILADVKMPGMSGTALYQALERDRPELVSRVVFPSGDLTQLTELGADHDVPSGSLPNRSIWRSWRVASCESSEET
jgi:CheY-like chemotaxis protein